MELLESLEMQEAPEDQETRVLTVSQERKEPGEKMVKQVHQASLELLEDQVLTESKDQVEPKEKLVPLVTKEHLEKGVLQETLELQEREERKDYPGTVAKGDNLDPLAQLAQLDLVVMPDP